MNEFEQSCLVFAARYAHNRPTAAAFMVADVIVNNWDSIRKATQNQLQNEAKNAQENPKDWARVTSLDVKK